MRGDFTNRRYSDDELRRIFEQAARSEARSTAEPYAQRAHTLDEMRAIAQEVGIDPSAVERAAANLVASGPSTQRPAPLRVFSRLLHEDKVLPRALSSAEMRLIAAQAERVVGRRGAILDTGSWVEWRDVRNRLYVGIVRGEGQTRIRAIADHSGELIAGAGAIGILGIASLQSVLGASPVQSVAAGALIVAATLGLIKLYWSWRSRVGREQLQEFLEILEDAVRNG